MSNNINSDSFKSSLSAMIDAILNNLVLKFDLEDKLLKTVELWPNAFVSSIPIGIEASTHEDELVEKYEKLINTWSKEYFMRRLENNEYLKYDEVIRSKVEKLNQLEDELKLTQDQSFSFEPWFEVFKKSVPEDELNEQEIIDLFVKTVENENETNRDNLIFRIEKGKYLKYEELITLSQNDFKN